MNQRDASLPIPDVQNLEDTRKISIDRVGIKAIRHPVRIRQQDGNDQHTIATFNMTVRLPHHVKGTHMSRFVEILNGQDDAISPTTFVKMLQDMVARLDVSEGRIEMSFPYFINKSAPISGVKSLLDYDVNMAGEIKDGRTLVTTRVVVPVTSLCPCSKEISAYGAHNQRSHVTITVRSNVPLTIEDIIRIAEDQASCELYGLLKRADEKYVTERAYDNPKFVEDMVRDVAASLDADVRVDAYRVESENFESIHNHSAYAMIEKTKANQETSD